MKTRKPLIPLTIIPKERGLLYFFSVLIPCMFVLIGGKCKTSPPPTPQPPPSSTSKTVNATIKIERNEGSGVVLPGQQYKYPNLPGYNGFPSTCLFTSADPAIIQV